jgi:hypothetical protein
VALIMLLLVNQSVIVRKVNRRKAPRDTDRLKALQETVERLVAEGRQIRAQMDELHHRDELRELRKLLRKQYARVAQQTGIFSKDDPSSEW